MMRTISLATFVALAALVAVWAQTGGASDRIGNTGNKDA